MELNLDKHHLVLKHQHKENCQLKSKQSHKNSKVH